MPSCLRRRTGGNRDPQEIRKGKGGKGRELEPTPQCYHHCDACFEMGSDESHFNVSLIVRGKDTRVHKPQLFE